MADICPVCNKEVGLIGFSREEHGVKVHVGCNGAFSDNPNQYLSQPTEEDEAIDEKQAISERLEVNIKAIKEGRKSLSEERFVHVRSFDMPFEDMIMFMVKWALASIPAFIILFIIFGILFAIFGALFF